MKNLFACSLWLALIFGLNASGEGFQKKRPAPKRSTTRTLPPRELAPPPLRSTIEELRRENEKAVEVVKPANETEAEVSSFIAAFDLFTKQLAAKIIAAATPLEGVSQAQKFLDAQRAEMKLRFEAMICIPESKVSKRFEAEMKTHFYRNGMLIGKLMVAYGSDYSVHTQYLKLTKDYLGLFEIKAPCPAQTIAAR
jgi:hypothetical protein